MNLVEAVKEKKLRAGKLLGQNGGEMSDILFVSKPGLCESVLINFESFHGLHGSLGGVLRDILFPEDSA
jgi:hypothetical protein